jgi:ferredoxin-NADP reductase
MIEQSGQRLIGKLANVLRQPWPESVMRLSALESVLAALHPMLSLTEVKVRVVRVVDETADVKTFILQPNALWQRRTLAGQFVRLRLEINGRRVERVYSLSSAPASSRARAKQSANQLTNQLTNHLTITVKRQPGGLVSNYLHDVIKPGAVLTISQAAGEFVLPEYLPPRILLLGAGSGITPLWAMVQDLQARRYQGSVVWLQVCRSREEQIFAAQLAQLAASFPALRLITHITGEQGRLDWPTLRQTVPDLHQRSTWLCGPQGLMQQVQQHWQDSMAPLHSERFSVAPILPLASPGSSVQVHFAASGAQFTTRGDQPLLAEAERAGLQPKHGCRIGICRSCQCKKHSGTVQNLQTGEISDEPNQLIRLCISAARSDLSLDL